MYLILLMGLLNQISENEYDFRDITEQEENNTEFYVTSYLSIPYSSFQFKKQNSIFIARYHILLQLLDRKKNVYGAEKFGELKTTNVKETRSRHITVAETLRVTLPKGHYKGNLSVSTLGTSRTLEKTFEMNVSHHPLGIMKITDATGNRMLNRPFNNRDTLKIEQKLHEKAIDSVQLCINGDNFRSVTFVVSNPDTIAHWSIPLSNFASNNYQIKSKAFKNGRKIDERKLSIRLRNPFKFDATRYFDLVDKLLYLTSSEERDSMKSVPPEKRQETWEKFWKAKDPTPQTEYNETMENYLAKIEYCERKFSYGDKGYKSDRARVFMIMGKPDEVEDHPFEMNRNPYIVWRYLYNNSEFIFEDKMGFGEYKLIYPEGFLPAL